MYPTKVAAAEAVGLTTNQLAKWLAGETKVPVDGLWRLAQGVGANFSWLCTGIEPGLAANQRLFNEPVLRDVLKAVAMVMKEEDCPFNPDRFASLVFHLHDYVIQQPGREGAAPADLPAIARLVSRVTQSSR